MIHAHTKALMQLVLNFNHYGLVNFKVAYKKFEYRYKTYK